MDEDVEFDHIIPWSKGGSSDEHNVKLLCKKCNRKKGNKFEEMYLVESVSDHFIIPVPFSFVKTTFELFTLILNCYDLKNYNFTAKEFSKILGGRKVTKEDEKGSEIINDIKCFFISRKPKEFTQNEFDALKYRWGFGDSKFHKIQEAAKKFNLSIEQLYELDYSFVERLGFMLKINERDINRWKKS